MTKKYDSSMAFRYRRNSVRQKSHNYRWSGSYFVTICAEKREPVFEKPELRVILIDAWKVLPGRFSCLTLDEFVIMPDHIHFIVHLEGNVEKPVALGEVIRAYKSITAVTWLRYIETNKLECSALFWQRGYHDHVIRDVDELEQTRQYIRDNPLKQKDES